MESIPKKDIYHIYELEAHGFDAVSHDFFWKNLFQAGGVFVFMTFVVFFMINFRFISSQIADWYEGREYQIVSDFSIEQNNSTMAKNYFVLGEDKDKDGLSDDLETVLGTNIEKNDSDDDGYSDFQEISQGYDPLGNGKIKAEINVSGGRTLPVIWGDDGIENNDSVLFIANSEKTGSIFNQNFIIPADFINNQEENNFSFNLLVYFNDGKMLKGVYREKTREIIDFSEKDTINYGVQVISGWPKGTDWQRLIISTELISLNKQ